MPNLTIKTESLPTRCEICHQADLFDPFNGICQRCSHFHVGSSDKKRPEVQIILPELKSRWSQFADEYYPLLILVIAFLFEILIFFVISSKFLLILPISLFITLLIISKALRRNKVFQKKTAQAMSLILISCSILSCDIRLQHKGFFQIKRVPIFYGYPSQEGNRLIQQGHYVDGGCNMTIFSPSYAILILY